MAKSISLLTRIRNTFAPVSAKQSDSVAPESPVGIYFGGTGRLYAGREGALALSSVWRCVNLLSGRIANLIHEDLTIINEDGTLATDEYSKSILKLIKCRPNTYQTGRQLITDYVTALLLDGNALMRIVRPIRESGTRPPLELEQMDGLDALMHQSIGPAREDYTYTALPYHTFGKAVTTRIDSKDVAHARWPLTGGGLNSTTGRTVFSPPPAIILRAVMNTSRRADMVVDEYFGDDKGGLLNKLAIVYEQPMPQDQWDLVAQNIRTAQNTRQPLVLGGKPKIERLNDTPQDAELAKLREYQVAEIARVYGVPTVLLGINITGWGSGIESLTKLYYEFGERLYLKEILTALESKLLPPDSGTRFKIHETDAVKTDAATATSLISAALGPNHGRVISIAEARKILGVVVDKKLEKELEAEASKASENAGGDDDKSGDEGDDNGDEKGEGEKPSPISVL